MKKLMPWIVVLGVLAIIALWVANVYNGFVTAEEQVESAWAQVENQYQRRADLVPNLVATVKGYAEHEKETLDNGLAKTKETVFGKIARAVAGKSTVDEDVLDIALELQLKMTVKYLEEHAEEA